MKTSRKITIKEIGTIVVSILKSSGAKRAAIFGSAARGTMKKDSDIDILVELPEDLSLIGFVGVKIRLEKALKRKVDLVEYSALKAALKKGILKEQVKLI